MSSAFPSHVWAPEVPGDGVVLCPLEPRDAPAMLENDRDPETAARFEWAPTDAALWRCEQHIERAAELWQAGQELIFAVRESADGPLVGIVDAKLRDLPPGAEQGEPAVELSWTTVPAARGRGVATSAVRALVAFVGTLGREQVWAKVERDNAASVAVARAAGLREVSSDERWVVLCGPTVAG
jgi:RimJ/RimL family protein N-acetyltransferase